VVECPIIFGGSEDFDHANISIKRV
jgi:hypothetical protein